jgi:heme exporter protein D
MSIAFASWHDFFAMGGYAFFVWLALALTIIPLLGLVLHTLIQRRAILRSVVRSHAREARMRAAREKEKA